MGLRKFRGTTVALITPFLPGGAVDEARLKTLVDRQVAEGTDVILAAGTTGEASTLSTDEHKGLMKRIIELVDGRRPVLCGTGSNSTREAIGLTEFAESVGCDGILSVGPYYNKPTQEGFYQHFKEIAASTSLPVILYNVPGRTGTNIAAHTTLRLAEIPNIVGIKEASGDLSQIMEIIRLRPDDFSVLSGDDAVTLPLLAVGSDGVISVVANETPGMLHKMVHAAFDGDWETARELHYKLLPLMEINFIESNPIPAKTALAMMGLIEEEFRLPLVEMGDESRERLAEVLRELELIH
jgi:4-hydroxy-tetrahydrodipicolinate synthase